MNKMARGIVLSVALALLLAFFAWRSMSQLVDLLPGQVRGRLPEEVLALVTTPFPTSLPVLDNARVVTPDDIVIPAVSTRELSTVVVSPPTTTLDASVDSTNSSHKKTTPTVASPTHSATHTPIATITPIPLRLWSRLEGVDAIPQKFNNCGPANLSMALNFHGFEVGQLDISSQLKPNYDDRNVSPDELVHYVNNETTLRAAWFSGGELQLLKRIIANGYPVIVEKGLFLSEWQGWMGHYLTLYGYDDAKQQFDSMDTFLGPWDGSGRPVDYQSFSELWLQFNNTFVIVYPAEDEADLFELLGTETVEPVLMWQRAALASEIIADKDPDNQYAWFNMGTSMTHLGELTGDQSFYENAAAAFDQAMKIGLPWRMLWYQFEPYAAYQGVGRFHDVLELTEATLSNSGGKNVEETFFYRGQALVAIGELEEGTKAYEQALKLRPDFDRAIEGLQNIAAMQQKAPRTH